MQVALSDISHAIITTSHTITHIMSEKQNEDKPKVLVTLEEDDEFEDFPIEGEYAGVKKRQSRYGCPQ